MIPFTFTTLNYTPFYNYPLNYENAHYTPLNHDPFYTYPINYKNAYLLPYGIVFKVLCNY